MKILKEGNIDRSREKIFECNYCDCEFLANEDDRHRSADHGYHVVCPCCESYLDWDCGKHYMNEDLIKSTYEKIDYIVNYLDIEWSEKYEKIFSSGTSKKFIELIGGRYELNWYDPDSSYEDDVRAFYYACEEYMQNKFNY